MRFALTLAAALIVVTGPHHRDRAPASAPAAGGLYTVAGNGEDFGWLHDGAVAVRAALGDQVPIAALPAGGFPVSNRNKVWRVDPQGVPHHVAGTPLTGDTGDGGPATAARIDVSALAGLPGGGFLIADQEDRRVRLVAADGTIATVAGGGRSRADGVPATRAALRRPVAVAALPGGGFLVDDDDDRVREVGPDG